MNGSAKRMMAMLAVLAMIASAMVVVFADEQDSSADTNPYFEYYRGQLDTDFAKHVYEGITLIDDFSDYITVTYSLDDKDQIAERGKETFLSEEIAKGLDALRFDHPEINYYFGNYSYTETVADTKVKITPQGFDPSRFNGDKTVYDGRISSWVSGTSITGTGYDLIRNIHNYVSSHLNYDDDGALDSASAARKGNCRSVYNTLDPDYGLKQDGRNLAVCEGYAKMFKVLCDYYEVPCLIVTGVASTTGDYGNHMWNYVLYEGQCFLVDCTWDCREGGSPVDDYLLAGNYKSPNSVRIVDSHNPCGITEDYDFYEAFPLPTLSPKYVNDSGLIVGYEGFTVRFMNGTTVFREVSVPDGETVAYPGQPKDKIDWHFLGWKEEGAVDYYDFSTPVTANLTLIADSINVETCRIVYNSMGGSNISNTIVRADDNTTKITDSIPFKEGFKFIEWNTSKDGTGLSYKAGDDITIGTSEITLYAIWEDTNSVNYKINSFVDKAAEFLGKETIPGVSNMLLTILVITAAVSLLAILAISRK